MVNAEMLFEPLLATNKNFVFASMTAPVGDAPTVKAVAGDGSIRIGYIEEPAAAVCHDRRGPRARALHRTGGRKDASLRHHGKRGYAPHGSALVVHHEGELGRGIVGNRAASQRQAKRKRKSILSSAENLHFKPCPVKDNYTVTRKNCVGIRSTFWQW